MSVARQIPLDKIRRNPKQPRETFPDDHIERLAASIKTRGLIQPIMVRLIGTGLYQIVVGECRFRAHQLLKRKTIAAEVVDVDDLEMQLRAIVENLQRRDMNPLEEARAFQALLDAGFAIQQIVDELGLKSQAIVRQRIDLLDLAPEIQKLVSSGNLAVNMAWGIAQAPQCHQSRLIRDIQSGRLKTSDQVKHAGIALRDAASQSDAFANIPKASRDDVASIKRLEAKIETIAQMVLAGFKDGECVAAQRVSAGRVTTMADKLSLIRRHVLEMEHDLRRVAMQTEIRLEAAE